LQKVAKPGSVVQRRVGFEFQTNILLRNDQGNSPPLRTPLFEKLPGWKIECDQGELEFITVPLSSYGEVNKVVGSIVEWAGELARIPANVSEETRSTASHFAKSTYQDERELGAQMLKDGESRALAKMSINEGTDLESLFAIGDARAMVAKPQTTIGIPLDKLISSLHLVASQKMTLDRNKSTQKEVALGADQEASPVLVSTHDATVTLVNSLRTKFANIPEADWRKLEGVVGLASSYIRSAQPVGRNVYAYIKMMAPMMSRVNFSAMYNQLSPKVQKFFTPDIVATAAGVAPDDPLFGRKGALKGIPGPKVMQWVRSIIAGRDALSTLGIDQGLDTEKFIVGSESMGEYNKLDTEDPVHDMPLVPVELRQMTGSVPVYQWLELAHEIMIFSNALNKAKFY